MRDIAIIAENKVGVLANITALLSEKDINLEDISCVPIGERGVITLKVEKDKYDETLELLRENNYHVVKEDALVIKMSDKPGELAKIAKLLSDNNININHLHIISRDDKEGIAGLTCDNLKKAKELLKDRIVS